MPHEPSPSFLDELERKQRQRRGSRIKSVLVALGGLSAVTGAVYEGVLWGIDQRVSAIVEHRMRESDLSPELKKQTARVFSLENDFRTHRQQLRELYRLKAGEKAAELERDRRKKARAADAAREKFDYYVQEGDSLFKAYIKAAGSTRL